MSPNRFLRLSLYLYTHIYIGKRIYSSGDVTIDSHKKGRVQYYEFLIDELYHGGL